MKKGVLWDLAEDFLFLPTINHPHVPSGAPEKHKSYLSYQKSVMTQIHILVFEIFNDQH